MLSFNKYRKHPCFHSAVNDLKLIVDSFIEDTNYSVTLAPAIVLGSCWGLTVGFSYTILYFEYTLPTSLVYRSSLIKLPGHLYFYPGEEISLSVLRSDLLRGDLSSYESPQLTEEET